MAIKDLIPWNSNKGREVGFQCGADTHPLFAFHREMNRMFDDVFRGFDLASFDSNSRNGLGWPQIYIDETDKEVRITAELPGLEEKTSAWKSQTESFRSPAKRRRSPRTRRAVSASGIMAGSNGAYRCRMSRRQRPRPRLRTAC
jgi:hypothetical protein